MIFISRDLIKLTGKEHDIVVETVTLFVEVFNLLTPRYQQILLQVLSKELERIDAKKQESSDETD